VVGIERLNATSATPLTNRWNDASGGLGYHWRAWRYRDRLWHGFHAQVARWLDRWQPAARTLILIGPSGGYALPAAFLARFDTHLAIEPDPLARWLLRRRFRPLRWQFIRDDVFGDTQALERLSSTWPDAAFLFCNVIGQVMDADMLAHWRASHAPWLGAHAWASWHDVFSSDRAPRALPSAEDAALGPECAADVAGRLWRDMPCRVEDHGSFALWPQTEHVLWQLTPHQWHVIGWASHHPGKPAPTSAH
jgi:hypothetical protein